MEFVQGPPYRIIIGENNFKDTENFEKDNGTSFQGETEVLILNPFYATGPFLYPMKTSENLWFSDVFEGYRKRLVV